MRPPRGGVQQLDMLRNPQRAEFWDEGLGEGLVGEPRGPVRAPAGAVVELPEMDELVDRAGVALEVADQVLRMPALFERRKSELLIERHGLGHLADIERVGAQFIKCHRRPPSARAYSIRSEIALRSGAYLREKRQWQSSESTRVPACRAPWCTATRSIWRGSPPTTPRPTSTATPRRSSPRSTRPS